MITRIDPVSRDRDVLITAAAGQHITVTVTECILIVYAYGSDNRGHVHTTTISDVSCRFPDMMHAAYTKIENELRSHLSSHNINVTTRHCTCGHRRGKQDGYTRLNEFNDWGCGRCRKPTIHFLEKVIIPREIRNVMLSLI